MSPTATTAADAEIIQITAPRNSKADQLIEAIRADKIVGRGTCSVIDECYSDAELTAALVQASITTKRAALSWARATQKVFAGAQAESAAATEEVFQNWKGTDTAGGFEVKVCGPNLHDQTNGTFHVHAAGCADLKNYGSGRRAKLGGEVGAVETFPNLQALIEDYYGNQIAESNGTWEEYADDFYILPCAAGLLGKATTPKATKPAGAKKERRNETTHPDGAAAVAAHGCPTCMAKKGKKCIRHDGEQTNHVHSARMAKYDGK